MFRHLLVICSLLFAVTAAAQTSAFRISTLGVQSADSSQTAAPVFEDIRGLAADPNGNVYVAEPSRHRVIRINPTGNSSTIAGTGSPGFSGDDGLAASAQLNFPYGVAADAAGNVYVADLGNARVRRITSDGRIRTVAGGGTLPVTSGATGLSVALKAPRNLALDSAGNVFFSDFEDHRVLRLGVDGRLTVVAGTGVAGGAAQSASALTATLRFPAGLALDAGGAVYVADSGNHVVRRISGSVVTTVTVAQAETYINLPTGVAVDAAANVYIAANGLDHLVKVTPAGVPSILISGGIREVAMSPGGVLYSASGTEVRRLDAAGQWTSVTATAAVSSQPGLTAPTDVFAETGGGVLVADNLANRVVRLSAAGAALTVAGTGEAGFSGDGGAATQARLNNPQGVAAGAGGVLYISDTLNHRVRRVDAAGVIQTIAGTGSPGNTPASAPAVQSAIYAPTGIAVHPNGDVYFSDTVNHMIRRITPAGLLIPVAGTGQAGFRGDLAAALSAQFNGPKGLAFAPDGSLYVADSGNHRVRRISPQGVVLTVAGTGVAGYSGDAGAATDARLSVPTGVAVDSSGAVYVADSGNQRIRRVSTDGLIQTVAGTGTKGFSGDLGAATAANLDSPSAVSVAISGTVFVADRGNQRIRQLTLDPSTSGGGTGSTATPATGEFRAVHAATLEAGAVAPGMLLTILGEGIGPAAPAAGKGDATVQATQVLFDGQPAPLVYLQSNMIQAQAPYRLAERASTLLQVMRDNQIRGQMTLNVAAAVPGIFTIGGGAGPAAALNEDLSVNSEIAAAARGGLVTLYLTGEGALTPASPYPRPTQTVAVRIGGQAAELVSASGAVSLPGLLHVTVRVPRSIATGAQPLQVTVGSASTQGNVTVYVK